MHVVQPPPPIERLVVAKANGPGAPDDLGAAAEPAPEDGLEVVTPTLLSCDPDSNLLFAISTDPSVPHVAVGWLEAGAVAVASDGKELWRLNDAHPSLESLAFAVGEVGRVTLLSSGNDGAVRAWDAETGSPCGGVQLAGASADREIRGLAVVQRVASTAAPGGGALLAAASGRSVFSLQLSNLPAAEGQLLSASPARPALPSMIVDLCFAATGGCLAAATTAAGVFIWDRATLADPTAPASRNFVFGGSCISVALSAAADCCVAACTDRTLRVWGVAEMADRPELVGKLPPAGSEGASAAAACTSLPSAVVHNDPMTFGGFSSTHVSSLSISQAAGVQPAQSDPDQPPPSAAQSFAAADGAGGVVIWSFADLMGKDAGQGQGQGQGRERRWEEWKARCLEDQGEVICGASYVRESTMHLINSKLVSSPYTVVFKSTGSFI